MNLNQVTVPSTDVARAVSFYRKLGLELIVDALPHYARFLCPNGQATFSVHEVSEAPKGNGIYVYFECKDLDTKVANLRSTGVEFDEPPSDRSWGWREARVLDPDGNRLILYWAGEVRINPPWRVGSS